MSGLLGESTVTAQLGGELARLFDVAAVGAWMDSQGLAGGPVEAPTLLAGGTQNVLIRFRRAYDEYVLRRPPRNPRARAGETVLREARVLSALGRTAVPHPDWVATCADDSVLGAPFVLMRAVVGTNPIMELPAYGGAEEGRRRMGVSAATALARVGQVDHLAAGLGGFGRPEGFLERQVARWLGEWETYHRLPGYPGEPLPHMATVAHFLTENRPRSWQPGLMHGDFHLGNLLYHPDRPDVAAVVDWEMATIGDPLVDLGRFLATLPDEHEAIETHGAVWDAGGIGPVERLVACYAEVSGRDLDALNWYVVLGCFKLGIILEGSYARACAGQIPAAIGDRLHGMALTLFARAHRLTGRGWERGR